MSKVLISLDDKLLRRIDREARSHNLTRSAYLAQLAERDLGAGRGPGSDPEVRAALRKLDRLSAKGGAIGDVTAAIRAARDSR